MYDIHENIIQTLKELLGFSFETDEDLFWWSLASVACSFVPF